MSVVSSIWEGVKNFFQSVVNFIRKVINGVLNFYTHVLQWYKRLKLRQDRDIPFLMFGPTLKEMLKGAPKKDVGIFKAVYNEETETITHHEFVEADALDEKTREVLGDEELVVLS
ncbi:MAG: hypothetical protein K6A82_01865 [Prevotella sp.]|nr:hypothetical protein [Prevotella sp.]